jgi:hypothetical protein
MTGVHSVKVDHLTVVKIVRRKCHCGCGKRVTHYLAAGGCNMGEGCEWDVWKRLRRNRPKRSKGTTK